MKIIDVAGSLIEREEQSRIVSQHFDHEALELFNDRRNGNLADGEVWMWNRLVPANPDLEADAPGAPSVLAILETGDPLLVESKLEDGVILQLATSLDASWSNLPARSSFLPFVQQLISYLASHVQQPRNLPAGHPLVAHFEPALAGASFKVNDPEGIISLAKGVAKGTVAEVEFTDTLKEGLYTITNDELEGPVHLVTSTPRAESRLARLSKEELEDYAIQLGAHVIMEDNTDKALERYTTLENQRKHGREMWRILMLCVLGFMVGELMLQQFFGRAKS